MRSANVQSSTSDFVFVNKNSKSRSLSRSHGAEKSSIYGHVKRQGSSQHVQNDNVVPRELRPRARHRRSRHADDDDQVARARRVADEHDTHLVSSAGAVPGGLAAVPFSRSYEFFRQKAIAEAAGWSDREFWDAAVQLSAVDGAIFHALSSLGALHQSLITTEETSRAQFQESLMHCNKAIRLTLHRSGASSLPFLLVSCAIFTTIQLFADVPMAHQTLVSGIELVKTARKQESSLSKSEHAIIELVAKILQRYRSRMILVLAPNTVLEEHPVVGPAVSKVPTVPVNFDSLLQARDVLQTICAWPFLAEKNTTTLSITNSLQKQWLDALSRLYACDSLHPLSLRSLNLLKAARLGSSIVLATMFAAGENDLGACLTQVRQVLSLYSDVFKLCKSSRIFTHVLAFDDGIEENLIRIKTEAQDPTLRSHAQAILCKIATVDDEEEAMAESRMQRKPIQGSTPAIPTTEKSPGMHLHSLEFFTQTAQIRLRFARNDDHSATGSGMIEQWFSMYNID